MKNICLLYCALFLLMIAGAGTSTQAQTEPVLYFCERYDSEIGEVGVADRFSKGYLTVMVKCNTALGLEDVTILFKRWDGYSSSFKEYKRFEYLVEPDMSYIFFSKNADNDMSFDEPGFYRVFLLDDNMDTVTSALIEIIQ